MKRFFFLIIFLTSACSSTPTPASFFDPTPDSAPSAEATLQVNTQTVETVPSTNQHQEAGEIYFFYQPHTTGQSIELVKVSALCIYDSSNCPALEKIQVPFQFNFVIHALSWSADGKYAAFAYADNANGSPTKLWIFDADKKTWTSIAQFAYIDPPFWSAENLIAFRAQDGLGGEDVYVINADGSGLKNISANLPKEHKPYSLDGWVKNNVMVRSALSQKVFLINLDTSVQEFFQHQIVSSPTGDFFVFDDVDATTNTHTIKMFAENSELKNITQFNNGLIYPIVISPDNNTIAFNYYGADNQGEVYIVSKTGENLTSVYKGTTIGRLLFSPNGKYLLIEETTSTSGGHLFLINLTTLEQKILQAPNLSTDYDWYAPSWRP